MTASATCMALLGLGASFFPHEVLAYFGGRPEGTSVVLINVLGALYLGFAILNWMAREKLIGGIYSRPVALGNFVHFLAAALVLIKQLPTTASTPEYVIGTVAYSIFAGCFGYVVFAGGGRCG